MIHVVIIICGYISNYHNSHLYKESIHIHAVHDAELLRKVDDINNTQTILPNRVMIRLQAGAFLSLCYHLRMRSDTVQNMELMTISGFCRNCLAKVSVCVLCSTTLLHICADTLPIT